MKINYIFCLLVLAIGVGCQSASNIQKQGLNVKDVMVEGKETAILAGGCFWCIEAPLLLLDGVDTVISGYMGGQTENPTYAQVSMGRTGHAEVVKVIYAPAKLTYDTLLESFFLLHDPTQLNRQGNDIGTQYRSAIFPVNAIQKAKAEYYISELNKAQVYNKPIVTTIEDADVFYTAEDYHQNYYNKNPQEMYCQLVVKPKLEKFKEVFASRLKTK